MKYELCYLVGESKEQEFARIKEDVSAIISKEGGKWLDPQIEEKRKMAYRVGREVRGVYVAQQFEIVKDEEDGEKASPLDNINKKLNLYNDILRFIIIKAEDLPELKVREGKPVFAKDSGNDRGSYKKPVYIKKTEIAPKEKVETKKEEQSAVLETEAKEEKTEKKIPEPVHNASNSDTGSEKVEDKKSIDEKIDEILNI